MISYRSTKILIALLSVILLYCSYKIYVWSVTQSTDNAYVEADISEISAEINGVITEILVKENALVKTGELIAKIDDRAYKAIFDKSNAAIESAQRNIEMIEQSIKLAEIKQKKAQEFYLFTEQNLKFTECDFARIKNLTKDSYASQKNLDAATIGYAKSKTEAQQAKFDQELIAEELYLLQIKLLEAQAHLKSALAENVLAKKNLDHTEIYSPIDGLIANSIIRKGNFVNAGRILFSVVPLGQLYIKANFKETQIANMTNGMEAEIFIDAINRKKIIGKIRNISPATGSKFSLIPSQNATGNFTKIVQRVPVIIDFELPAELQGKVTPGMSSFVKIRTF